MDFIRIYITQLLKNSCTKVRIQDSEKDKTIARLITNLQDKEDLFPELKEMESITGLEEVSNKLIAIYKRLNKTSLDFEKVSYQFVEDREGLISSLRRFIQNTGSQKANELPLTKRRKIVFDDTSSTFYEINYSNNSDIQSGESDKTSVHFSDSENIKTDSLESSPEPEIYPNSANENTDYKSEFDPEPDPVSDIEIFSHEETKPSFIESNYRIDSPDETEVIPEKSIPNSDLPIELTYNEEEIKNSFEDSFENSDFPEDQKAEQDFDNQKFNPSVDINIRKNKQTKSTEKFKNTPSLFNDNFTEQYEETIMKSREDEFLLFETRLMDNIKLVDEYLFKIIARLTNPEFENQLVNEAGSLYHLATKLEHHIVARLIKTYWYSLLAIREKKLSITKSEAELIRSTLIIIVAMVKNKDIELHPYWMSHNSLVKKLNDLSYEV